MSWQLIDELPSSSVEIGKISGPFGIHGLFKIYVNQDGDALLHAKTWYMRQNDKLYQLNIEQAKRHTQYVLAKSSFFTTPEQVEQYRHAHIYVRREDFPPLAKDEFYWVDLIGKRVINQHKKTLGVVQDLMQSPGSAILSIATQDNQATHHHLLIPFLDAYVKDIRDDAIHVHWEMDDEA